MCGISAIIGNGCGRDRLLAMRASQAHRGPDGVGLYVDAERKAVLGHNRLSIIDLTAGGDQPMMSSDGRFVVVQNGEIYNYLELKQELSSDYSFRTRSDTEVLLAAYAKWGVDCLDHFVGMFAFAIWDTVEKTAFAARDRFGVKPLYYHQESDGMVLLASEIKALHAAGIPAKPDDETWATYLAHGLYDHSDRTFWTQVTSLPGGHYLQIKDGKIKVKKWYDIAERVGIEFDTRSEDEVREEYFALMKESVTLRFRSDVPVGINLSGGLDSSSLLGLVHEVQGKESEVKAFTFTTGDAAYDELLWVEQMLAQTRHPLVVSQLTAADVPALAAEVQSLQDEPFGGLPTLAYARLFEAAKNSGVTVLLDGNGMDEQWAGYDYYSKGATGHFGGLIQGTKDRAVRPECLTPEFRSLAKQMTPPTIFPDRLRNLQYRDIRYTKIPRAMRFNDRVSMRVATELREPFLDHRLFEIAMRQPSERKIKNGVHKNMLRDIARTYLPRAVSEPPKRPIQTPQREWLRGPLREWAGSVIETSLSGPFGSYLDAASVRREANAFFDDGFDNSYFIWQWISLGLIGTRSARQARASI
ncbi:MAG: asparagine synthase (glutamine-hydrolyzing) [Pyrinomonadaceae bacterium]|nr:asparagine synthase (glutamine-hydrolyzing) [Pyrinomonadaceae bacterium]